MNIAVNTRLLLPDKLEGIGWFTYETLKRITTQHPEHHFYFIFDRPYDPQFIFNSNVTPVVTGPPARHPVLFYLWFEFAIPQVLRKNKADLFLSPDGYLSLSSNVKSLPVIHDINFAHYPQDVPYLVRHYYNYFFPRFARKATRIATVSEYSRMDISKMYHIDPSKIDVVYNGVNESFKAIDDQEKEVIKKQFSKGCDYYVFVGSLHPRKNIVRLFKAFDIFKKNISSSVKLIIVGEKYWWNGEIESTFQSMQYKDDVIFTGRLSSKTLNDVIASSIAMTYVPYFEGFGIPILEAFKCETALITSNVTSMPEVADDAALLVNPFDEHKISDAMQALYTDKQLRNSLIGKGKERLQFFSWQQTADKLWDSIEKTVR